MTQHECDCGKCNPATIAPAGPDLRLLVKLGSIVVHADELLSPMGHGYDKITLLGLIADPEVQNWIKEMGALLPLKRRDYEGAF